MSGWSDWTWKATVGGSTPAFNAVRMTQNWIKLIKWMDSPSWNARSTVAEAESGMTDYLCNMRLANTTRDARITDALAPRISTLRSSVDNGKCIDNRWRPASARMRTASEACGRESAHGGDSTRTPR